MTTNEILVIAVKALLGALPFAAIYAFWDYFNKPDYSGRPAFMTPRTLSFWKSWGIFVICLLLSIVSAAALMGLFNSLFLMILVPALVYGFLIAFFIRIIVFARHSKHLHGQEQLKQPEGFINEILANLFKNRSEYSYFYVTRYSDYVGKGHPETNRLAKHYAILAVRKNKNNPEARYILSKSYVAFGDLPKARKSAAIAVELDRGNEKYKKLLGEIEGRVSR